MLVLRRKPWPVFGLNVKVGSHERTRPASARPWLHHGNGHCGRHRDRLGRVQEGQRRLGQHPGVRSRTPGLGARRGVDSPWRPDPRRSRGHRRQGRRQLRHLARRVRPLGRLPLGLGRVLDHSFRLDRGSGDHLHRVTQRYPPAAASTWAGCGCTDALAADRCDRDSDRRACHRQRPRDAARRRLAGGRDNGEGAFAPGNRAFTVHHARPVVVTADAAAGLADGADLACGLGGGELGGVRRRWSASSGPITGG